MNPNISASKNAARDLRPRRNEKKCPKLSKQSSGHAERRVILRLKAVMQRHSSHVESRTKDCNANFRVVSLLSIKFTSRRNTKPSPLREEVKTYEITALNIFIVYSFMSTAGVRALEDSDRGPLFSDIPVILRDFLLFSGEISKFSQSRESYIA